LPDSLIADGIFFSAACLRDWGNERAQPRKSSGPFFMCCAFDGDGLDAVCDAVNASGYGLTLGVHSRIDERPPSSSANRIRVGNIYVNRKSKSVPSWKAQPFGGERLSGTGPKAGRAALSSAFLRWERSFYRQLPQPRAAMQVC